MGYVTKENFANDYFRGNPSGSKETEFLVNIIYLLHQNQNLIPTNISYFIRINKLYLSVSGSFVLSAT